MGNCTGYCTGCKEGEGIMGGILNARLDNQQVRNSYNYKEEMIKEGFGGEAYSGFSGD